ncbi:unnamed protein product [Cylicocyclus nassatus]|uniref:Saposin B-type domain-containing protein n=1 Tax=Cylicocyclus nassatus TaxID=53992 RepID=A0AA36H952_CYLNA|nr:unnamed protein product [Cylicocyclus nassatus]
MKLLLTLLLLSIFAIATCDEEFIKGFCGVCPYFTKLIPEKKVDCKDIQNECKKGKIKEFCAIIKKTDETIKQNHREKMKNLTWKEACKKFC